MAKIWAFALVLFLVGTSHLCSAAENKTEADDHHDHDHKEEKKEDAHGHHKCACEAREQGWKIDCVDKAAMQAAQDHLNKEENHCDEKNKCTKEFLILQAHHDHCPHDSVPTGAEKLIHQVEKAYTSCEIPRQFNKDFSACPAVKCTDKAGFEAAAKALKDNNCTTSCKSDVCKSNFQTILSGHDNCEEDELPTAVEEALHDFEESCEDNLCNTLDKPYFADGEKCEEEENVDGTANSGARTFASVAACAFAAAALFLA